MCSMVLRIRRAAAHVTRRLRDRAGQGTVEYFLIVTAIAVLVGVAIFTLGGNVGKQVVLGQSCVANATATAASATSSGFTGTGTGPCQ